MDLEIPSNHSPFLLILSLQMVVKGKLCHEQQSGAGLYVATSISMGQGALGFADRPQNTHTSFLLFVAFT